MFEAILFASQFAKVINEDPITGDVQAVFAVAEDDNVLAVVCRPGSGSIDIRLVPDRYYGASSIGSLFWQPSASSRFRSQEKPDRNSWDFSSNYLSYNRPNGGRIGTIKHKARFLHRLATDNRVAIRWEARQGDVRTVVFNYDIRSQDLADFIGECGPKRVIKYLDEWDSPAAPSQPEE